VALLAAPARAKGLSLSALVLPAGARPRVCGDAFRVRQVLENLIGNAVKFTRIGGVAVTLQFGESVDPDALSIRLCVQDTGIGIPPESLGSIFGHFTQADGSTTREHGGTGLGLAICKRLVALMGGEIRVESQPGRGSSFIVDLALPRATMPRAPASDTATESRAALAATDRPGVPPAGRARVLLVEDNLVNQQLAIALLDMQGLSVVLAKNGAEAVAQVCQPGDASRFDLTLMDCQMPVMDGYEATRRIRVWEREGDQAATMPIIALTAGSMAGDREACLAAGMTDYLTKPFSSEQLSVVVARYVPV